VITNSTRTKFTVRLVSNHDNDSLYDGTSFLSLSLFVAQCNDQNFDAGFYGEEFEEDFSVSTLDNPSDITNAVGDDATAELLEPPEEVTPALEPEEAKPIPTLDSRPRLHNADALPPKPASANGGGVPLSYSAQVAEQFSSAYRQTPSQERGRLDAARLAQFQVNQTGAPSGSTGASPTDAQARPIRPSEMKDEGCVILLAQPRAVVVAVREGRCAPTEQCVSYLAVVSTRTSLPLLPCYMRFTR